MTTPQIAAQSVAQRAAAMAEKVELDLIGVIENMSWFRGDDGKAYEIFGSGGGQELADHLDVPLLGQVPLVTELREGGDTGAPIVVTRAGVRGRAGVRTRSPSRSRRSRRARSTRKSCGSPDRCARSPSRGRDVRGDGLALADAAWYCVLRTRGTRRCGRGCRRRSRRSTSTSAGRCDDEDARVACRQRSTVPVTVRVVKRSGTACTSTQTLQSSGSASTALTTSRDRRRRRRRAGRAGSAAIAPQTSAEHGRERRMPAPARRADARVADPDPAPPAALRAPREVVVLLAERQRVDRVVREAEPGRVREVAAVELHRRRAGAPASCSFCGEVRAHAEPAAPRRLDPAAVGRCASDRRIRAAIAPSTNAPPTATAPAMPATTGVVLGVAADLRGEHEQPDDHERRRRRRAHDRPSATGRRSGPRRWASATTSCASSRCQRADASSVPVVSAVAGIDAVDRLGRGARRARGARTARASPTARRAGTRQIVSPGRTSSSSITLAGREVEQRGRARSRSGPRSRRRAARRSPAARRRAPSSRAPASTSGGRRATQSAAVASSQATATRRGGDEHGE